ncbi:hypothetical protein ABZ769_03110 [Streptomyces olivoreticuli]
MAVVDQWHASPCRDASPTIDDSTGEIRVPLALFQLDQLQGPVELVLSRVEAVEMYKSLSRLAGDFARNRAAG